LRLTSEPLRLDEGKEQVDGQADTDDQPEPVASAQSARPP